ncbi:hypothetical protein HY844_00450 [Candidatus Berkelbacteria bacterium]|nr:hypothetical protein [Candidatus Berkelbacteria bacterium]
MPNKINFKLLKKKVLRSSIISFTVIAIVALLLSVSAFKANEDSATINESLTELTKKQTISITREWNKIKKQSQKDFSNLEVILKSRKENLEKLLEAQQYSTFYLNILPDEILANVPANLTKYTEKRANNITGKLTYVHGHKFSDSGIINSVDFYYLNRSQNGDFDYQIFPTNRLETPTLRNGDTVTINNAVKLGENIVFQPYQIKVTAKSKIATSTAGHIHGNNTQTASVSKQSDKDVLISAATSEKTAVVILFNFSNDTRQPVTKEQVYAEMFTNPRSVDAYYEETSFNQVGFAPGGSGVTGWVTINNTNSDCGNNYEKWGSAAENAARNAGYNISAQHKIYFFPSTSGCGFGGIAEMPGNQVWINGWNGLAVYGHELGHNLGTDHASTYTCSFDGLPSTFSQQNSCSGFSEYGDSFDIMGQNGQFTTYRKAAMGYLSPANIKTVGTNGEYTIKPLEFKTDQPQTLQILRDPNSYTTKHIYLDYRRPSVIDNYSSTAPVVNGISIHLGPDYSAQTFSYLLDANPSTSTFSDSALAVGKSVTDPKTNIRITTLALDNNSATVKVEFLGPTCQKANPKIAAEPYEQWGNAGDTLTYSVTVTNEDNSLCSSSSFAIKSNKDYEGSGFTLSPTTFDLAPGQSQTKNITVTSSSELAAGYYAIQLKAYNISNTSYDSTNPAYINYKISSTDIIAPVVNITNPIDGSTVSGRVNIIANATDDSGVIASMQLYIDGALIKTYTGVSSFVYAWSSGGKGKNVSYGTKQIRVVATDNSGGVGEKIITVNVQK